MTTTLLRTKLYIPRPTRSLVQRQALVQRLETGLERDLTLVVAPVGYGKTTLVATWAAQTALPVAWLTLNENDNDLIVFLSYLLAAIRTLAPAACPQTQRLLENERLPEIDLLATFLINEIDDLPQRFVLVLDDYHLIHAPVVHRLLDSLLRHPPLQMHLLIASRADPPLALSKLRATQRLYELRIKDLRFSPAEAESFLVQTIDLADRAHAVQVLATRAEGWIAGLQLAALSLRIAADQAAMLSYLESGVDRYIMDYLFEQVLNRQPPAVQAFLLKTSILEQISPPLAQAVADEDGDLLSAQVSLPVLERAGIFVNALDNSGEWYGYHALFRELLRLHLQTRYTKAQIVALHRRASTWFRAAGLIDEALQHALAAGDIDLAAQIIVDHFAIWLDRENWPAIERWLNLLPPTAFMSHPWLLVAKANIAQLHSDYGAMLPLLEEAEARLSGAAPAASSHGEAVLRSYLDLLWAIHWLLTVQPQQAITAAEHALQSLPPTHRYVRGTAQNVLTVALQVSGQVTAAEKLVQNELARTPSIGPAAYSRLRLLLCLMSVQLAEGNLGEGRTTASILLQESISCNAPISQLWAQLALGAIAYETNDLPRALEHFTRGADLRFIGHMRGGHECLIGLALTHQAMGRTAEAQSMVRALNDYDRQSANRTLAAEAISLQLHLELLNGELPALDDWGNQNTAQLAILLGWREIPALTRIHALLATSSSAALAAAQSAIDELLTIATALHKPARRTELLALKARLFEQLGQRSAAIEALEAAVTFGEPHSLIRSIADAGPQLEPVLLALAHVNPSPFLDRVLKALHPPAPDAATQPTAPRQPVPQVRLTRREREVLTLLAAYQTDREIAEALVISPLTVRSHIEHLAEKLAVNGRRAIIARAIEMNLLA